MKKIYLSLTFLLILLTAKAQFSEDFESYPVGSYLAQSSPAWNTWSGAVGGNEDVKITNTDASSGTNSIYFSSTAPNGGPTDIVLPFGSQITTGQFEMEMKMKVEANKGAYFNLQGNQTIGEVWAMDAHFLQDGSMILSSGSTLLYQGTYTPGTWFEFALDINLNLNQWEVYIDNVLKATFSNPTNKIASLNLYPVNSIGSGGNNIAGFFIDDVSYTITPYTLPALNGAVVTVNSNLKLAGKAGTPTVEVKNLGTQAITSFTITLNYNGNQLTKSITGVNIPSLGTYEVTMDNSLMAVGGNNNMTVTISNVNGQATDGDPADDTKVIVISPAVPAPGKIVIAEEGTGPWCGWCPRGTVAMFEMTERYPEYFKGIAIQNGGGNPMVVPAYDQALNGFISGYPSALVDRGVEIDPAAIEQQFLEKIQVAPAAILSHDAHFDGGTGKLTVDVLYEFQQAVTGSWKVALVVTEDSVTGTTAAYNQVNYYSYQAGNIPLVGAGFDWQQLPNPVPASIMVYDHVARAITPSFHGASGVLPSTIAIGDTFHHSFTVELKPSWDMSKMNIVSLLISPANTIDNAGVSKVSEATGVGIKTVDINPFTVDIFPNPAHDIMNIVLDMPVSKSVAVTMTDLTGKIIHKVPAKELSGRLLLPVDVSAYNKGIYFIQVKAGNDLVVKKVMIQ